ncbi:MAG: M24 family metallopeptidase [Luteitalea sp.]|nr:M24 family metallopeptidase [Luteitalea sp.]
MSSVAKTGPSMDRRMARDQKPGRAARKKTGSAVALYLGIRDQGSGVRADPLVYTADMPLDVAAVQAALREERLDAWLLYDFRGSNPIARKLAGVNGAAKLATRRWYYLLPAAGEPRGLVHRIEPHALDALPGHKLQYADRGSLEAGLSQLLDGCRRVAMEYSAECAIPYIARVDAGTVEAVRGRGVEVISSGDLVQRFEVRWSTRGLETHRAASERLYRIKDRAFDALRAVTRGRETTEYALQQDMVRWFADEGLVSDSPPVVAAMAHAGDPHYLPTAEHHGPIRRDELVLLDLWGKLDEPDAMFADITWVAVTGRAVRSAYQRAFEAIAQARDAAVAAVTEAVASGRTIRGFEVDRAARAVLDTAGYADHILHRTGHSLGETVHGNGANLDDYETHDDRRLLSGTGFTVEPGLYFDTFGVRTEIDMYIGDREATVTGPRQAAIVTLE